MFIYEKKIDGENTVVVTPNNVHSIPVTNGPAQLLKDSDHDEAIELVNGEFIDGEFHPTGDDYMHFYASSQDDLDAFEEYLSSYSGNDVPFTPIKAVLHITKNDETEIAAVSEFFSNIDSEMVWFWVGWDHDYQIIHPENRITFNGDATTGSIFMDAYTFQPQALLSIGGNAFLTVQTDVETGNTEVVVGDLTDIETIAFDLQWLGPQVI